MNVAASNTTVSNVSGTDSSAASKSKTSSKTSDKSFDEEIKAASKSEDTEKNVQNNEKTESKSKNEEKDTKKTSQKISDKQDKDLDKSTDLELENIAGLHGEINFTDFKYSNTSQSILSQNIQNLIDTKDLLNTINTAKPIEYDSINMSQSDADFFVNLVQKSDMSMENILSDIQGDNVQNPQIQRNIQVSSTLMEKLSEASKTNKPFRIDFDKNVSVIIKVNKDGSIAANFIPGDKAVEEYLRNNISALRQRFDEEELAYSQLSYSNSKEREQKHKKENDNE